MLRYIAVLALVAAVSGGMVSKPVKCPMAIGKYPFDMEKFQGDWYVAAGNERALEKKGKCGKINFPYDKDYKEGEAAMHSRFTGVSAKDSTPIAYENYFTPLFSDKAASYYGVSRPEGTNTYTPLYKHAIIATDYSSYAVYVACRPDFDANTKLFSRAIYAEIWTRQGISLSKDTYETLTNVLSSYDIEPSSIKMYDGKC